MKIPIGVFFNEYVCMHAHAEVGIALASEGLTCELVSTPTCV
jgi:hypothetical protein